MNQNWLIFWPPVLIDLRMAAGRSEKIKQADVKYYVKI
jgi:hypothetical protein